MLLLLNPVKTRGGHAQFQDHANDRYLRLYTNPPDDIAASYVEDL